MKKFVIVLALALNSLVGYAQPETLNPADLTCTPLQLDPTGELESSWRVQRCQYTATSKYSREGLVDLTPPNNAYRYEHLAVGPGLPQPAASLKLVHRFDDEGAACVPDNGLPEPGKIIINNSLASCPSRALWNNSQDWGGIAYGPAGVAGESLGWRYSAALTKSLETWGAAVDVNAGVQLEGTSYGGTTAILQTLLMKDEYWRSRVTKVNASISNTLFVRKDFDVPYTANGVNDYGWYWRGPNNGSTVAPAVLAAWKTYDYTLADLMVPANAAKVKGTYFRHVGDQTTDTTVYSDSDFFRLFCQGNRIACYGSWHAGGHITGGEPGNNVPLGLFSGGDSDVRLDRILPVFTNSTGNNWNRTRGHYNLGLEWHSNAFNVDNPSLVLLPIRYRHHVNLGNGQPDQPDQITVDLTLRRIVNFPLPVGKKLNWTFAAHAGYPQQTGKVTVTTAGEVTIPNLTMKSVSAFGGAYAGILITPDQPWKLVYTRTPHLKDPIAGYPSDVEVANFQHVTDVAKINNGFTEADLVLDDLSGPGGTSGNTLTVFDCWTSAFNCAAQEGKVSPDGTKIAYSVSFAMPGGAGRAPDFGGVTRLLNYIVCSQIYIYNLTTGTNTPVPNHPGGNCSANDGQQRAIDRQPAWLDNNNIVMVSNRANKYPHRFTGFSEHLIRCQNPPACVSQAPYDVDGYGQANKALQLYKMNINTGAATNIGPHDLYALAPDVMTNGDIIYSCFQAHADKATSPGNALQVAHPNLYWLCSVDSNGADMTVKFHGHKQSKLKTAYYLPSYPTIGGRVISPAPSPKGALQNFDEVRGVRVASEIFKGKVTVSVYYRGNHLGSNGAIYGFNYGARMVEGCSKEAGCMPNSALVSVHQGGNPSTVPGSAQFVPSSIKAITPWGQSADGDVGFIYLGEGIPYRAYGKAGYAAPWDANNFIFTHSLGQTFIGVSTFQMGKTYLGETTSSRKRIMKVNAPGGTIPITTNPFDTAQMVPLVDLVDYNVWDAKPIKTYQELFGQAAPTLKPALNLTAGCFIQVVDARKSELFEQTDQTPQRTSTRRCAHQGCAVQPQNENPNYIQNNMHYFSIRIPELFDFYYRGNQDRYKMTMNTIGFKDIWEYQRVKIQPDGSVKMRVPCDTPLLMAGQNINGENIAVDDVMHSLRPGETRTCFGCHDGHSEERYAQLIAGPQKTAQALFALKTAAAITPPALGVKRAVPKFAQIGPIISNRCGACHNSGNGETGFENDSMLYSRIVWDTTQQDFAWVPQVTPDAGVSGNLIWRPFTSRFVSKFAIESPLYWYAANKRLDGRTNEARNWDIDYIAGHPVSGVTPAERSLLRDWLDNGAPYQ